MTRLLAPFARVVLGDRVWRWGDGRLKDVSVTLGEGDKSSSCSFSIYDKGRLLTDDLLIFLESIDGLEPLEKPEPPKPKSTGVSGGSGTASGDASANMRAALDLIAFVEVGASGGYNTQFGGGTFSDFSRHPNIDDDLRPAGRYQIQYRTFKGIAEQEGLTDFSPQSQDKAAIALIAGRGATAAIEAGDIEAALNGTGGLTGMAWEWAALPIS